MSGYIRIYHVYVADVLKFKAVITLDPGLIKVYKFIIFMSDSFKLFAFQTCNDPWTIFIVLYNLCIYPFKNV